MAITVPFHELGGTGGSHHSVDRGNAALRRFLVKWAQRDAFVAEIATLPHPTYGPSCAVNQVDVEPVSPELSPSAVISDPTNDWVTYEQNGGYTAVVSVNYDTDFSLAPWPCDVPKPTIDAGTQLVVRIRASTQVLRFPGRIFVSSGNPNGDPSGWRPDPDGPEGRIIISTSEYQAQWYYVDQPPLLNWRENYRGKINSTSFMGCEAETLLFEGYDVEPSTKFDPSDPFCFTVTAHFRERRIVDNGTVYGWNDELTPEGWDEIKMKDGGGNLTTRYLKADFANLFTQSTCSSSSSSSGV